MEDVFDLVHRALYNSSFQINEQTFFLVAAKNELNSGYSSTFLSIASPLYLESSIPAQVL